MVGLIDSRRSAVCKRIRLTFTLSLGRRPREPHALRTNNVTERCKTDYSTRKATNINETGPQSTIDMLNDTEPGPRKVEMHL